VKWQSSTAECWLPQERQLGKGKGWWPGVKIFTSPALTLANHCSKGELAFIQKRALPLPLKLLLIPASPVRPPGRDVPRRHTML